MGDVDGGQVVLLLHGFDEVQDLGLDGHIQGGGGLVADEDLGPAGHGDGDDHPLAHAAGELVGVLLVAALRVVDAHVGEDLQHRLFGGWALQPLVELHGLLDLCPDGLQGVEGGHGVLEDHGDLPAPDLQPVLVVPVPGQVLAVIQDGAAVDEAVCVQQAHEGLDEHGLPRAGLPHDGQALPLVHVQGHAPDGVEGLPPEGELHVQVPDGEDDVVFHRFPPYLTWLFGSAASAKALPMM